MVITYDKQLKIAVCFFTHINPGHGLMFSPKLNDGVAPAVPGYNFMVSFKSKGKLFFKLRKPIHAYLFDYE